MIRKCLTALLSLLLALMLPVCAMAGTQHTLTIIPGESLPIPPAVTDLLDVLSLTVTSGQRSGALTLGLDGMEIATVALGADATGLYAHSALLSDDVLYITWDDAFALLKDTLSRELYNENVNTAGIDSMLSKVDEAKEQLVSALGSGMTVSTGVVPQEEILAEAETMFQNDPEMLEWVEAIYGKLTVEDGVFTEEGRDAADQKYSLVLTQDELRALMETDYVYQMVWNTFQQADPDLDGDSLKEMTDQQIAELRKAFENCNVEIKADVFTLDAGETPVGMNMAMHMSEKGENAAEIVTMLLAYNRFTDELGINHKASMNMMAEGEEVLQMLFNFTRGTNEVSEGTLALLVEGEEITIAYHAENPEADVREREVALYLRSNAAAIIPPAASDRPLATAKLITSPADPALLSNIEAADASNSVNVMKLSAEEMQQLIAEVSSRSVQAIYSALAKLPTSVLMMVMGGEM